MKNCRKLIGQVLSLVLTVSLLSGCSSDTESATNASIKNENEMQDITYTVMFKQAIAEYPPDGGEAKQELQKVWEEELGITNTDYEVILASGTDYSTKLNAMMAGGDVPDYFQIDIEDLQSYVDNNLIVPIDEYVELMPEYSKLISTEAGELSYDNFMVDGKHYGFIRASLPGDLNGVGTDGMDVRTDWLQNLGLEEPKTIEELHDVLVAFTYDDPDGNGVDDTYGLGGSKNQMFSSIFGAYGIYLNGLNSWTEVDGELVHSTVLPETKEALATLQQWYTEGLIDSDKFVIEGTQSKDKFIAGKFGIWETTVWWASDARLSWEGSGESATCAMITPITGPDGDWGYPVNPVRTTARVISKNCAENKDPERFAQILDLMVTDTKEGLRLVEYGIEGVNYNYNEETDFFEIIDDARSLYSMGYSNPVRWPELVDRRWIAPEDAKAIDFKITNNTDNWLISEFVGTVPAMKDYPDLYSKLWSEYFTKIVTGDLSIDAWDEYVEKFQQQGGKELTEQVNEAWKN